MGIHTLSGLKEGLKLELGHIARVEVGVQVQGKFGDYYNVARARLRVNGRVRVRGTGRGGGTGTGRGRGRPRGRGTPRGRFRLRFSGRVSG